MNSLYGKVGVTFGKSKSKSKGRNVVFPTPMLHADSKMKRLPSGFDYLVKVEGDPKSGQSSRSKYDSRGIKDEPVSDTEFRNESESDTDSDSDKKKKKSHDKSKKHDKGHKSRKSDKGAMGLVDDCSLYGNNANSDDNSNDSGQNYAKNAYQKAIKSESSGANDAIQRDDAEGQTTNTNLDKSSSSEFDNEKPSKIIKVNISLDYDDEVYNEEASVRKFHKYQRNIEVTSTLQVTSFEPTPDTFPFQPIPLPTLDSTQQMNYSSSDSDSDDSDANDPYEDSDNSSCDECALGPCSSSVLPPLANGDAASSPAMSMSYYNKNGESTCISNAFYLAVETVF